MPDLLLASGREKLWHKMRSNLAQYIPEVAQNQSLMCCACGRFLPQDCFDLEHIIPQQALQSDPHAVRNNPETPKNIRAGNLLLCKKPLRVKGMTVYRNGCNSWKGRHYDKPIADLFFKSAPKLKATTTHQIAALVVGYLAMVAKFGYAVVLTRSGLLLREQFFRPHRFHPGMPIRSKIILAGQMPDEVDAKLWTEPFGFAFERDGACVVTVRNFAIYVPISRDPRLPFAKRLIVPAEYRPWRPDFRTFFE